MVILDELKDFILIGFGAVFGANTRFIIYQKLEKINLNKHSIILLINTFSSFFLGLFIAIASQISSLTYYYQLGLFFSTFIYDLYDLLMQFKFYIAFKLFIISLTLGILSFAVGFLLGMYK